MNNIRKTLQGVFVALLAFFFVSAVPTPDTGNPSHSLSWLRGDDIGMVHVVMNNHSLSEVFEMHLQRQQASEQPAETVLTRLKEPFVRIVDWLNIRARGPPQGVAYAQTGNITINKVTGLSDALIQRQLAFGNKIAFWGDSMTAGGNDLGTWNGTTWQWRDQTLGNNQNWTWLTTLNSNGRLIYWANVAQGGQTSTTLLGYFDDLLATSPDIIVLWAASNDFAAPIPTATTRANIKTAIAKCQAKGILPVLMTFPPREGHSVDQARQMLQHNLWLRMVAYKYHLPLIDVYGAVVEPRTGGWKYGYDINSTATGGTYTLTVAGQTTAAINWNDTAATVQTRLNALSTIGTGGVWVTGTPGAWVIRSIKSLTVTNGWTMTANTASLTGGSLTLTAAANPTDDGTHPNANGALNIASLAWTELARIAPLQPLYQVTGETSYNAGTGLLNVPVFIDKSNIFRNGNLQDSDGNGLPEFWNYGGGYATPSRSYTIDADGTRWHRVTKTTSGIYIPADQTVYGKIAMSDLTIAAGSNLTLNSTTANLNQNVLLGANIVITGGTGWTPGTYNVQQIFAGSVVDRSPGAAGLTGGVGYWAHGTGFDPGDDLVISYRIRTSGMKSGTGTVSVNSKFLDSVGTPIRTVGVTYRSTDLAGGIQSYRVKAPVGSVYLTTQLILNDDTGYGGSWWVEIGSLSAINYTKAGYLNP